MSALELKSKLIKQFEVFIEDDSKLIALNGIFDSIDQSNQSSSIVPEEHYYIIEARRRNFHTEDTKGSTWEDLKKNMKTKYGV
ncbi:MAG: hypothetical protein ACPG4W_04490 [Flavobacteriales bacterium]